MERPDDSLLGGVSTTFERKTVWNLTEVSEIKVVHVLGNCFASVLLQYFYLGVA